MEELILRNYWLLTLSLMCISIFITIGITKYHTIKSFILHRLRSNKREERIRSVVYEVLKELTNHHKKYVRQQVRQYLNELRNDTTIKKRRITKKKDI